jgi:hypothetical protein
LMRNCGLEEQIFYFRDIIVTFILSFLPMNKLNQDPISSVKF